MEGTRGEGGKGAEGKIRNKMRGGNKMKDQNMEGGGGCDHPRRMIDPPGSRDLNLYFYIH